MTTNPSAGVDLDQVLVVADGLHRICKRALRFGVPFSTFKQESWEAALAHVQDLNAGCPPRISSDGAFNRLLASSSAHSVAVGAPRRPPRCPHI